MSIEATFYSLLGPLVGGRCYPDTIPDGQQTFPLIIYQQVGGRAHEYMDKSLPDHDHARMQVVVWSKSRLEASQIARQARVALVGSSLAVETYGAPTSLYEEALKLYGSRTHYGVWYPAA